MRNKYYWFKIYFILSLYWQAASYTVLCVLKHVLYEKHVVTPLCSKTFSEYFPTYDYSEFRRYTNTEIISLESQKCSLLGNVNLVWKIRKSKILSEFKNSIHKYYWSPALSTTKFVHWVIPRNCIIDWKYCVTLTLLYWRSGIPKYSQKPKQTLYCRYGIWLRISRIVKRAIYLKAL